MTDNARAVIHRAMKVFKVSQPDHVAVTFAGDLTALYKAGEATFDELKPALRQTFLNCRVHAAMPEETIALCYSELSKRGLLDEKQPPELAASSAPGLLEQLVACSEQLAECMTQCTGQTLENTKAVLASTNDVISKAKL